MSGQLRAAHLNAMTINDDDDDARSLNEALEALVANLAAAGASPPPGPDGIEGLLDGIAVEILGEDRYGDAATRGVYIAELHKARNAMRLDPDPRWAAVADLLNDEIDRILDIGYRVTTDWIERNHRAVLAVARAFMGG